MRDREIQAFHISQHPILSEVDHRWSAVWKTAFPSQWWKEVWQPISPTKLKTLFSHQLPTMLLDQCWCQKDGGSKGHVEQDIGLRFQHHLILFQDIFGRCWSVLAKAFPHWSDSGQTGSSKHCLLLSTTAEYWLLNPFENVSRRWSHAQTIIGQVANSCCELERATGTGCCIRKRSSLTRRSWTFSRLARTGVPGFRRDALISPSFAQLWL